MKRLIAIGLVLACLLAGAGCGGGGTAPGGSSAGESTEERAGTEPGLDAPEDASGQTGATAGPSGPTEGLPAQSPPVTEPPTAPTAPTAPSAAPAAPPAAPAEPQPLRNDAYFDRALFIGDSIMEGIRQYVAKQRNSRPTLGEADFLTTTIGIALADLVGDRQMGIRYSYKGAELPVEEIVAGMEADRIFLLLGLNDLSAEAPVVEQVVDRYLRLIRLLQGVAPGAEMVIITNPPKVASSWLPNYTANREFNNELIDTFVAALIEMCQEEGIPYLDAHALLEGEGGALPDNYCRDGYVHLNDAGSAVLVEALYDFAAGREGAE